MFEYPHTNLNQPNLDYVCKKIGEIDRAADKTAEDAAAAATSKTAAEAAKTGAIAAENAAVSAKTAAESAKTAAETAKADAIAAKNAAQAAKTAVDEAIASAEDIEAQTELLDLVKRGDNAKLINELMDDEHFFELPFIQETVMPTIVDKSHSSTLTDETEDGTEYHFTDFLKCKKYLLIDNHASADSFYLYFYTLVDGEYVINWDIIKQNSATGIRNRIVNSNKFEALELPDNCYIRMCKAGGDPHVYTWDGVDCGIPISGDIFSLSSAGAVTLSSVSNLYTCFVPNTAKVIFTNGCKIKGVFGLDAAGSTGHQVSYTSTTGYSCYTFAPGTTYKGFYVVLAATDETNFEFFNNLKNRVICIADMKHAEKFTAPVNHIAENAKAVNDIAWIPVIDNKMLLRKFSGTERYFHSNHKYHGVPYSGFWEASRAIGWNVSPHTFVNAIADINSCMYLGRVTISASEAAPYYGLVCSSFVTLIAGFPAPNTNHGFLYSPHIHNEFKKHVEVGEIYSDGGHCFISLGKIWGDDISANVIAESLRPLTTVNVRYDNVEKENNSHFSHFNGYDYFDDYFYTAVHDKQTNKMSTLPYADFTDVTIVNGSARPYRGDKCVYTSADDSITVNLHGNGINKVFMKHDGVVTEIPVSGGNTVNVMEYVTTDGIYELYTNISSTIESFEFYNVTPIHVTITENNIDFGDETFWYAVCGATGNKYLPAGVESGVCVEYESDGNYSGWFNDGQSIVDVRSILKKGVYGSYVVPVIVD